MNENVLLFWYPESKRIETLSVDFLMADTRQYNGLSSALIKLIDMNIWFGLII
jgi:hypothetical protein